MDVETPTWPAGDPGKPLLHVSVPSSVDDVFNTLWSTYSDFSLSLHKVRGDTNYLETPWLATKDELPKQQFAWEAATQHANSFPAKTRWRKVRFDAPASGMASMPFANEEVSTCVEHQPGTRYIIDTTVFTNAIYGDKFSPMMRCTLEATSKSSCSVHVIYAVWFSKNMSRLVKPVAQKGIEAGIRGSFVTYRKILNTFHACEDYKEGVLPQAGGAQQEEQLPVVAAAPARSSLLDVLPLPEYLQQQAWCRSLLEHLPGGLDHGLLAQAAGVLLTLLAVQLAMGLLISPLQRMCSGRSGVLGVLCWPVTHLVDLPDSVAEVLCSVLLVAAVGRLLLAGAAQLQDVLGLGGAPQQAAAQQGATEARSGAAASAATDSSPVERSADPGSGPATWRSMWTSMTRAGSMRQRSATSATTTPRDRLSNSGRPPKSTSDLSAARSQAASAVTAEHQDMIQVGGPSRAKTPEGAEDSADKLTWVRNLGTSVNSWSKGLGDVLEKSGLDKSAQDNIKFVLSGAWAKGQEGQEGAEQAGSGPSSPPVASGRNSPSNGARPSSAPTPTRPRHSHQPSFTVSLDQPIILMDNYVDDGGQEEEQAVEEQAVVGQEEVEGTPGASRAASELGLHPSLSQSGATPPARSPTPGSARVSARQLIIKDGPPVVVDEVYEHERYQPIKGWGHQWPGHFLPSDRVSHWGDRSGGPGGMVGMEFHSVAPRLPEGWVWRGEWRVQITGVEQDCMDAEGWSYAVDFNWFTYPPPPGSGKMTFKSFVRRRRWVRTRERLEGAPGAAASEVSRSEVSRSEVSRSSLSASSMRTTQDGLAVAVSGPSASGGSFSSKALAVAAAVAASVSGRSSPAGGSPQLSPRGLGTTSTPGSAAAAAAEAASPASLTHKASLLSLLDHGSIASDSASSLSARDSPLPPLQPGGASPVPGATPEQQRTQQAAAQGLLQQISASSEEEELPAAAAGPAAAAVPAAAPAATSTPPAAFPTAALRTTSGSLQADAAGSPAEASSPIAAVQDNDDDPLEPMEEAPKPQQLKPALQKGGGGSGSNRGSPTAAAARAPRTRSPTHPGSGSSSPTSSAAAAPTAARSTAAAASPPPAQPVAPAAATPPAPSTAAKAPTSPPAEPKAPVTRSPAVPSEPRPVAAVAKSLLSPVATAAAPSSSPTAPASGTPSFDGSPSSGLSDFVNSKSSSFFSSMSSMVQNINTSMQSQINEVAEVLGSLDSVKSGRSPIASASGSRVSSGGLAGALRGADLARSSFGRSLTGGVRDKGDKDV